MAADRENLLTSRGPAGPSRASQAIDRTPVRTSPARTAQLPTGDSPGPDATVCVRAGDNLRQAAALEDYR